MTPSSPCLSHNDYARALSEGRGLVFSSQFCHRQFLLNSCLMSCVLFQLGHGLKWDTESEEVGHRVRLGLKTNDLWPCNSNCTGDQKLIASGNLILSSYSVAENHWLLMLNPCRLAVRNERIYYYDSFLWLASQELLTDQERSLALVNFF